MKESLPESLVMEKKEQVEVVVPVKKQTALIASISKAPGHTLWRMNLANLRVEKVPETEMERYIIMVPKVRLLNFSGLKDELEPRGIEKVNMLENHLYCSALNFKNAAKKFAKMLSDAGYRFKETPMKELPLVKDLKTAAENDNA